ncbi:MAG: SDR family oxidoreductase [bacterium]|jgi:3-oxoacyl-[acyl-carrier protein] reductase
MSAVAVVTGSTRNIGLAIAKRLAADGFRMVINGSRDESAAAAARREVGSLAKEYKLIMADVTTPQGAEAVVSAAVSEFGRLDLLVNNVGPFLIKGVAEMTPDEWKLMMDGNLSSAFFCCRAAIPVMRMQGAGHIINIGAPKAGQTTGVGAYGIAKTGVSMLARYIAKTEGVHGIRANCVNPGFIRTEDYTPEVIEEMAAKVPLGRLGEPEDIASAVSFLASPEASYISGAVLDVGGGLWV